MIVFLSTLSLRRATISYCKEYTLSIFLSTLSLRRATRHRLKYRNQGQLFYPRSPCGERPDWASVITAMTSLFYPRSPCGERLDGTPPLTSGTIFYPRSPCGERQPRKTEVPGARVFYPRSPCGERPIPTSQTSSRGSFSIHALLAESDHLFFQDHIFFHLFYPRSPCGERHTVARICPH